MTTRTCQARVSLKSGAQLYKGKWQATRGRLARGMELQ